MNAELPLLPVDLVALELSDVVADVVDRAQAMFTRRVPEHLLEHAAHLVRHELPVGERVVRRSGHRAEVLPPLRRVERRAAELPVGERDAVARRRGDHRTHRLVAHLVAKPPRTRVDRHDHPALDEPERRRGGGVVDGVDRLHLEEVVARAEGAELAPAALERALRNGRGVGVRQAAPLLEVLEVVVLGEAPRAGPSGPLREHLAQLTLRQRQIRAARAQPRRHAGEERVHGLVETRLELLARQLGREQAHSAVDVVTDAARRDHPLFDVERGDAPDREAVAPVDVGHRERAADDPGQARDVRDLLRGAVLKKLFDERLIRVDEPLDPHRAFARDPPAHRVHAFQLGHDSPLFRDRTGPVPAKRPLPARPRARGRSPP